MLLNLSALILKALLALAAALVWTPIAAPVPAVTRPPQAAVSTPVYRAFYIPPHATVALSADEASLFAGINAERAKAGLPLLQLDYGLVDIARQRAAVMQARGALDHTGYGAVIIDAGYVVTWEGENLAMIRFDIPVPVAGNWALDGMMASPGHRANILAADYILVGVGKVGDDMAHWYAVEFVSYY